MPPSRQMRATAIPPFVGMTETVSCPSCQATLAVDAAFCSRCGASLQLLEVPAGATRPPAAHETGPAVPE